MPFFDLPLNLPHAASVALRIQQLCKNRAYDGLFSTSDEIVALLYAYRLSDTNPPDAEAETVRQAVADVARRLVREIQKWDFREDRLGQCVRNLFECLAMGEEGARLSLLVGERENSLQRPV